MSTLYTAAEFNFIPTGKLPHKSKTSNEGLNNLNVVCLRLLSFPRLILPSFVQAGSE